jgi:hypothetical protein
MQVCTGTRTLPVLERGEASEAARPLVVKWWLDSAAIPVASDREEGAPHDCRRGQSNCGDKSPEEHECSVSEGADTGMRAFPSGSVASGQGRPGDPSRWRLSCSAGKRLRAGTASHRPLREQRVVGRRAIANKTPLAQWNAMKAAPAAGVAGGEEVGPPYGTAWVTRARLGRAAATRRSAGARRA